MRYDQIDRLLFLTCLKRYFKRLSTSFEPQEIAESANRAEITLAKINN